VINDREAIGANMAAAKAGRNEMLIAGVDGSPDIEKVLAEHNPVVGSASQDPFVLGKMAVELGNALHKGEKPAETAIKATPQFITRENLARYHGWTGGETPGDASHSP
jgi:ribose transport system substrate-binding protein